MTTRVAYADNGSLQSLPLVSTTLKSHIVDLTVSHTLTQVYNNSSTRDISEAHYTFPLYESSSVTDFQALVGEKIIKGVVKERGEAKAIYDAAKSAGKVTALFSQDTSEVFTTSVGNIPAGGSVVVVIKYVHELKQDIEVDGVKLVIPTVIAPKYGTAPVTPGLDFGDQWRTCWDTFSRNIQDIGNAQDSGISLSITATMSGPIRGVTSPSHPISIGLGSHSSSDDADFNPMKAHATLALASTSLTSLDKDFSLLISTNNIGDPRAFLAPHPTLRDTSTLMVTMVPRFALPSQGHEIIFVVDRSGSMGDKIGTVRDALQLFLASLPVGLYFNICSFGSNHSFLWPQSQEYSEASLNVAKAHVGGMGANMGGTEILTAIKDTMRARRSGMRTEILILTDGEVWNAESMFRFIGESSEDGNVRFFSLGVGNTVSHSLVEGIARAGRGYSQIVNIAGNLQKKVMRMLKAAMTPHVNDWDIDWAGKPERRLATLTAPAPRTVAPISLFDPNCDPDNTPFALPSSALTLTLPKVIQAPTVVPALFSYSRTTVYFLISNGDRPEKVFLKGSAHVASSNTICPLQIEIPVQAITSTGASLGLYQLAGRKLLQDLEEGRLSYLEGIYDKIEEPIKHAELITKEGARVGVEFGLASKWTSFVAVAEDRSTGEGRANQQVGERTDVSAEGEKHTTSSRSASSSSRGAAVEDGPAGRERANQQLERGTDVLTKGETRATKAGSASPSARLSKSALGSDRAAKRVSTSPRLQAQDNVYQQEQAQQAQMPQQQQKSSGGGSKGSRAPSNISGSGKNGRGASFGGSPLPPSPQSSGPSGPPTRRPRTGGGSFGAAPESSSRPVQAPRKRSSVKPIPQDGEGLKLVVETSASVSPPSRSQNFSSPTFSSPSGFNPSSPGHSPSSSHGSPPTSQAFSPTSPRNATGRYSATSPSCGPAPPSQACYTTPSSHSATSPPHSPTHQPRAYRPVRDSHSATSLPHSPTSPPRRACCAARGSHSTTPLLQSSGPQPQVHRTVRDSHSATSPPYSPSPQPQAHHTAQYSHSTASLLQSATPRPQVHRTVRDSHSATSPQCSPAPQSQVHHTAQYSHLIGSPIASSAPQPLVRRTVPDSYSTTSSSYSPAPQQLQVHAARYSHLISSPIESSEPQPQVHRTVRDSHSTTAPQCSPAPQLQVHAAQYSHPIFSPIESSEPRPQVHRIVQDSHSAISLSHNPAPQPQVYYVAQDPLGISQSDPFTLDLKDNLQSSFPLVQHYQEWQPVQSGSHNPVSDLATLPQSNGMFKASGRIFDLLGLRNRGLENVHADGDFVATVAVIVALEKKFPELSEEWEFMVSKAKEAVQKLYSEGDREAVVSAVRAALGD